MEIGNNLKNLRAKKNMTQKELAEALNVSYQAVSRWENNEVEPDISTLSKLSEIFGVSVDQIITGKFDEKSGDDSVVTAAAVASVTAIKKEEKTVPSRKVVTTCFDCHRDIYDDEQIMHLNRKFDDGTVKVETICYECSQKRASRGPSVAKCSHCGKELYSNDGHIRNVTPAHTVRAGRHYRHIPEKIEYVCVDCQHKQHEEQKKRELEQQAFLKKHHGRRHPENIGKKSLIFGGIFGIIALVVTIIVGVKNMNVGGAIALGIGLGYGVFSSIYCIFSYSYISEVFVSVATKSIHFPGIIFSWSLDGFKFLIVMKLLFAVLGFLFGIAVIVLAVAISMFLSVFSFPFVLIHNFHEAR